MTQETKNKRLALSLAVLTAVTVMVGLMIRQQSSSDIDKDLFKVADQVNINQVILQRGSTPIELKYNRTLWLVNNQEADRQLIKVFFAAILQAEPKRKLTGAAADSLRSKMSSSGTSVTLSEGGQVVKAFHVLGSSSTSETYYQLAKDEDIYVVTIPGYRVYLASIFELSENDWRDKRIFNFNWQNFKSLTATFKASPTQNFSMSFQNQYFGIEGMLQADTTKVNDYLDAVSLLRADKILNAEEQKQYDTLSSSPDFTIAVSDIANRVMTLEVYIQPAQILGRWNQKEWVILSLRAVQPIARRRSDFMPAAR